jgi:hypothetical protein
VLFIRILSVTILFISSANNKLNRKNSKNFMLDGMEGIPSFLVLEMKLGLEVSRAADCFVNLPIGVAQKLYQHVNQSSFFKSREYPLKVLFVITIGSATCNQTSLGES